MSSILERTPRLAPNRGRSPDAAYRRGMAYGIWFRPCYRDELLLGYLVAAFSIGLIVFIMARKMIKRIADARLARPRLLPRSPAPTSGTNNDDQRLAA